MSEEKETRQKGKSSENPTPAWLILLRPIDSERFPDSILVNDLVYSESPYYKEFEKSLEEMLISESNRHIIYKSLIDVWVTKFSEIGILECEATLGDVRKLNTARLKVINRLSEEGSLGVSIISKLFSLH